jgi:hypothetical protein
MMCQFNHHRRSSSAGSRLQALTKRITKLLGRSSRMQQGEIELRLDNSHQGMFGPPLIEQRKPHTLLDDNPCSG